MDIMKLVEASYESGILRPSEPLPLRQGERVNLIVVRQPDPSRWNLARLKECSQDTDTPLAEQGLADWAKALDDEDRN